VNELRATNWEEFIGQEDIVHSIKIAISASQDRNAQLDHILLYGPPGLGKTSLAHIIAKETKTNLKIISGPTLTRVGDLASILTSLEKGDILFIDEIHRIPKSVEESLYSAMEDCSLDVILGKGPGAKSLRLDLLPFTVVGATTKLALMSKPLRDRFGIVHHLKPYDVPSLTRIIIQASKKNDITIDVESAGEIAARSRGTPRIALKLLRRVLDFCSVEHQSIPNIFLTKKSLDFYQVDELGLDDLDRRILQLIVERFNKGPVGLESLAAITGEDIRTIEEVHEPYLMQLGFITRTPRGRTITPKAIKHLKL